MKTITDDLLDTITVELMEVMFPGEDPDDVDYELLHNAIWSILDKHLESNGYVNHN